MKGEGYVKKDGVIKVSTVSLATVTITASAVLLLILFSIHPFSYQTGLFSDESIWISEFAFVTQEPSRTTKRSYWSLQQPAIWDYRYCISRWLAWKRAATNTWSNCDGRIRQAKIMNHRRYSVCLLLSFCTTSHDTASDQQFRPCKLKLSNG